MTVIADDTQVHDIGGIMGGEDSGVSDATTDVMLEIAYFTPERIARTGQELGLTSDARTRFERGVDPAFLDEGAGDPHGIDPRHLRGRGVGEVRAGQPPVERRTIHFDFARTKRAQRRVDVPEERQREIRKASGSSCMAMRSRSPRGDATSKARLTSWKKSPASKAMTR